jgi:hypothetical protein
VQVPSHLTTVSRRCFLQASTAAVAGLARISQAAASAAPPTMRTILLLDDWPILIRQGIDRRWFAAEPWPGAADWHDPLLESAAVTAVRRDPESGQWRMWGGGTADRKKGDEGVGLTAYESTDGFDWRPMLQSSPVDRGATPRASHLVFSGEHAAHGAPFFDERESDPARRFKMPYSDLSKNPIDASYGTCRVAVSPDGIHWTIDKQAVWRPQHTDTLFPVVFNPYTGKYQWTGRPILGDRRVSLDQTVDWKHFDKPQVILHPDPMDPPGVEFYGMPQFLYEGYFLGFLWRMWGADNDLVGSTRFKGRVDAELTYSVNGLAWNRTNRQNFLPDRGPGRGDVGSEYPTAMVQDDQGWLRIYTNSHVGEHADGRKFAPGEVDSRVTVSRWRRDGFCGLESRSDTGTILLRGLVPRGGQVLLNATTGRFGRIRAELRDLANKPLPGYELDKSVPVTGDGHFLPLRWQDGGAVRETLDPLQGKPFKLYLELEQARLYAVRADVDLAYGFVPEKNLAGEYIPGRIQ